MNENPLGFTCNFCRNYMQSVIEAYPAMQTAGIEVIQVAPNLLDSARAYFDDGPPFPFVCDPDKRMYAVYGLGDRGVLEATKNMVISFTAPLAESVQAEVETIRASWMDVANRNFIRRLHHHALTAIDQGVFIIDKQGVLRYRQIVGAIEKILTGEEMLRLTIKTCASFLMNPKWVWWKWRCLTESRRCRPALLDLGKIEAGLNFQAEMVDLAPLILEVVQTQQTAIAAKAQSLTVDLPQNLEIVGDAKRLLQVWSNLIGNAIKYTPEAGRIIVSGQYRNNEVEISVQDTGVGIPAKDLPYVFDKFYRVTTAETKKIKGTGLGLAIVKSIVEAHNGRIGVTSTHGQGSIFTVRLPV
jgi:hypothetical protein